MNKSIQKAIVLLLIGILSFVGIPQVIGITAESNIMEFIDQSNGGGSCGDCEGANTMLLTEGFVIAQSFKPSQNTLSKVILSLKKTGTPITDMDATLIIRKELTGEDLTSVQKQVDDINLEFDFPDIDVITEDTYYMILMIDGTSSSNNGYSWYLTTEDEYSRGNCWTSASGIIWNENQGSDMFFKTYWIDYGPGVPTVDGPYEGNAQERYDYTFSAIDPEGDDIYLFIEWGDGRSTRWIGPFESGEPIIKDHQWAEPGNYSIQVRSKDVYGAVGEWYEFPISMPRNKDTRLVPSGNGIMQQLRNRICDTLGICQGDCPLTTITGLLTFDGMNFFINNTEIHFGPTWYITSAKSAVDYDCDGTLESIYDELQGLIGTTVTIQGHEQSDQWVSAFIINGEVYREAGQPIWFFQHQFQWRQRHGPNEP